MEVVRIFVDTNTFEGLYTIRYDGEELDEFERLFDLWTDAEYVREYLRSNQQYLKSDYFKDLFLDEIETEILDEAEELERLLERHATDNDIGNLQMLFKPLNNTSYVIPPPLEKTKARIRDRNKFRKGILRIYALRLGKNTFVVTGGAIKLVREMKDHHDTHKELDKLEKVKAFLKENNLYTDEDLVFYYGRF